MKIALLLLIPPDVLLAAPPVAIFRPLPRLEAGAEVVRPLHLGFTSRSMVPWDGPGRPPAFLITGHAAYAPARNLLYRSAGKDGTGKPFALPAGFPLYRAEVFDPAAAGLGGGRHQPVPREDGTFDLIHTGTFRYFRNTGKPGTPAFAEAYQIHLEEPAKEGAHWIGDVTGDGIPDLLTGGLTQKGEAFLQYPDAATEKGPWGGRPHPNMGALPDTDIQNFRGYDIAGNWLGQPIRKYLWWAPGSMKDGRLCFGRYQNVRYGTTDYRVQWQDYGTQLSPAVMKLENGTFIVLVSGPDMILALPLRGESGGELRTGKAVPFLKGGEKLRTANLASVIGTGDLNGDGKDELVIGSGANGRLTVLEGTRAGEFTELGNVFSLGGPVAGDTLAVPVRKDWDGDGDPDLILGDASGMISIWKGTADPLKYGGCEFLETAAGVIRHRPLNGNLQGPVEIAWSYVNVEVFDWDHDGKLDLITNDNAAELLLYRGTGKGNHVEDPAAFTMDGKPLPVAWRSRPAVIPGKHRTAGDDRDCLLHMTWDGKMSVAIPEKQGSTRIGKVMDLQYSTGGPILLSGPAGDSGRVKFSVCDWDGDGVWDVVAGVQAALQKYFRPVDRTSPTSAPYWLRNTGTNEKPVFEKPRLITHSDGVPIAVKSHSFDTDPTDLDGDGKPDLIFGDDEGFIYYLTRDKLAWDEPVE